jgi:hypothetical protein
MGGVAKAIERLDIRLTVHEDHVEMRGRFPDGIGDFRVGRTGTVHQRGHQRQPTAPGGCSQALCCSEVMNDGVETFVQVELL